MFTIVIQDRAERDLEKIPKNDQKKLLEKLFSDLPANPFPRGKNPKRLKGVPFYRWRYGDYRVIYQIIGNKVLILTIGHRKDVYRD